MSDNKKNSQTDHLDISDIAGYTEEQIVNDGNKQESSSDDALFYLTPKGKVEIKSYDPAAQYKVIGDRLQMLEFINVRFARQFRTGLFDLLHKTTDVISHPIEIQPYHQLAASVPSAVCLNLMSFKPLSGIALFVFSPELIYATVDNLFGGGDSWRRPPLEGRAFSRTEQRMINRILLLATEAYQDAWKDIFILNIEHIRSEMEMKFTNMTTSSNDVVLTSSFTLEIGEFSSKFSLCMPYTMLEPLRKVLTSPPIEHVHFDESVWRNALIFGIKQSHVELIVNFVEINTTVNQVLGLKIGDVLAIEKPVALLEGMVGAVPILKGRYGTSNKHYAIQVEQLINSESEPLNEEIAND